MPRTANGSIPRSAPAALVVKREERKDLLQQPTREPASWWCGPAPLPGRGHGRELRGPAALAFTRDNARNLLLGQCRLGWGREHPCQHRVKYAPLWQAVERCRGLPHRFHVTRTDGQLACRTQTRAGTFLAIESTTSTQRLTACQQKPVGQGIGQRQAAPSSVIRESRAAHPHTASTQCME